jgi:hypothetical protein
MPSSNLPKLLRTSSKIFSKVLIFKGILSHSFEKYWTRRPTFDILNFLKMGPIFFGYLHNFDGISNVKEMVYICDLMPILQNKILNGVYHKAGQVVQVVQDRKKARVRPCPRAQRVEPQ